MTVRRPIGEVALPLVNDLGRGETEVLMLGLEMKNAVVILDDALARRVAISLDLRLTGTLGLLLDAKQAGLITAVAPFLDMLQQLPISTCFCYPCCGLGICWGVNTNTSEASFVAIRETCPEPVEGFVAMSYNSSYARVILFKEQSYAIVGAAMKIHRILR